MKNDHLLKDLFMHPCNLLTHSVMMVLDFIIVRPNRKLGQKQTSVSNVM